MSDRVTASAMASVLEALQRQFVGLLYGAYKYVLHQLTGQCEIIRIVLDSQKAAAAAAPRAEPEPSTSASSSSSSSSSSSTSSTSSMPNDAVDHELASLNEHELSEDDDVALTQTFLVVALTRCLSQSRQLAPLLGPVFDTATSHSTSRRFERANIEDQSKSLVSSIASIKGIKHAAFRSSRSPTADLQLVLRNLSLTLDHALSINALMFEVEAAAATKYDQSNAVHEHELMALWAALRPYKKLSARISSDWESIGFQGDNPSTDMRGAGVLGLAQLNQFALCCPHDAQQILSQCTSGGLSWFSFAITGLNLTYDVMKLTRERVFDNYYARYGASISSFHALYSTIFIRFAQLWRQDKPVSVMEFSRIHQLFIAQIRQHAPFAHRTSFEFLEPICDVSKYAASIPGAHAS